MAQTMIHPYGAFSRGKKTQTAGTVIVQLVPPFRQQRGAVTGATTPKPLLSPGVTHVTDFSYVIGTTAHTMTVMRPLNYTWLTADAAAGQAVVNVYDDPGLFQTANRYKYPLPNAVTSPSAADNGIAGSDYVVYQAAAGQWVVDTVASVSSLAVTLTTNLPTGGAKNGALLYFFGITTDVDPVTNEAHLQMDLDAAGSGTTRYTLQNQNGLWTTHHAGDPVIFHSSNGTTAGTFELIAGFYSGH